MVRRSLCLLILLLLTSGIAVAQVDAVSTQQTAPTPSPQENASQAAPTIDAADKAPIFRCGFDWRFRPEDMNNYSDASDSLFDVQHRFRFRTRIWGQLAITDNVDFYLRLANEWRKTTNPGTRLSSSFPDELVVDNLYLDFKRLFAKGLSLRAGRQDIRRGEGFIFGDGTALDGSRTGYLNAFVLAYGGGKSKLEIIGAVQPQFDHYIATPNRRDRRMVEYDESAIGGYFTTKLRNADVDLYYILKKETDDFRPEGMYQYMPDRQFTTVGGRLNRVFSDGWNATGEFAYQFGAQHANYVTGAPSATIAGWGGHGTLKRSFDRAATKPYLSVGYFALSGDDYSSSKRVEGWDPVFSRFAIRSDLLFNSFRTEKGVGYWTNIHMPVFTFGVQPSKRFNAYTSFMYVDAFRPFMVGPSIIFASGTHRGNLIFSRAEFQLLPSVSTQVQYESMWQGDFYASHDRAYYFRAQLTYTFSGVLGRRDAKKK